MDANDLHLKGTKSLMDKIAADPDFINRGETPSSAALPPVKQTSISQVEEKLPDAVRQDAVLPVHDLKLAQAPLFNLLEPNSVVPATPVLAVSEPPLRRSRRGFWTVLITIVLLLCCVSGTFAYRAWHSQLAVTPLVTPSPTVTSTPVVTPTPVPTVRPTPTPVLTQNTVTAPVAPPTLEHPQMVTVQSRSGLWLRSSPSSLNQKNVIGWIPYNGQVSVDTTGDFWWHGKYAGKTGYFAVSYTK